MKSQISIRKSRETQEWGRRGSRFLESELHRLQKLSRTGFELKVEWLPGKIESRGERQLAEEVIGNTIFVYASNPQEALCLVAHGFFEWLLNAHSRSYREMINKLIELFELQQYEKKEAIIEALVKLFAEGESDTN